mmetsp:Transcript_28196/g.55460  ORF Transcript_28196/g.55460 Transcript_28196/m.55460 type:complete len:90 (-) Transcript_28196:93-362(-)
MLWDKSKNNSCGKSAKSNKGPAMAFPRRDKYNIVAGSDKFVKVPSNPLLFKLKCCSQGNDDTTLDNGMTEERGRTEENEVKCPFRQLLP